MAAPKGNKYNAKYTQEEIDELISGLLEWAHRGEGVYISSYIYETYKKPKTWIYDLSRHHKDLKDALEQVSELLSGKIANYCLHDKKYGTNASFGEKILPMYSKEYKATKEWLANLGKDSADQSFDGTLAKLLDLMKEAKK